MKIMETKLINFLYKFRTGLIAIFLFGIFLFISDNLFLLYSILSKSYQSIKDFPIYYILEIRSFTLSLAVISLCFGITKIITNLLSPIDWEKEIDDMKGKAEKQLDLDPQIQAAKSISRAIKRVGFALLPILVFLGLLMFFASTFTNMYTVQTGGM